MSRETLSGVELLRAAFGRRGLVAHCQFPGKDGIHPGPLWYYMTGPLSQRGGFSGNARKLAVTLVNGIERYRDCYRPFWDALAKNPHAGWIPPPLWTFPDGREYEPGPDSAWRKEAGTVSQFSPSNWKQWAEIAWKIVIEVSPEGRPELEPALTEGEGKICNVRRQRVDPYFGNIRRSPGIALSDIKQAFFDGFEEIATNKSKRAQRQR